MATSRSSTEQTSSIGIDIDGAKHRLQLTRTLSHSSSVAELRNILTERYDISSSTRFLDSEGYTLFPGDEQSVTISQLLNENNIVQLKTDKSKPTSISIPERKNMTSQNKVNLQYVQPLDQSTATTLQQLKLSGSTAMRTENTIVLATDLDLDMWEKIIRNCNLFRGIRMDKEKPIRAFKSVLEFIDSKDVFSLFQVTDHSNIRIYMKDKEMQSSFISSNFFDGGIEVSNSLIGIGVNAEYLKSKATTNIHKKTYLTCCFNFPRVTLELDSSYLEPTSEFVEAIDNVLSILTIDEQIIKLEEVLSKYGHVYPRSVVLGGHLYHTEVHDNKKEAEEAKKRKIADGSFSASFIKGAKIQGGGGHEEQSQNKSSEQTSMLTFEAVGGDARYNRDPTLWTNTIADPSLWRIIEEDDYQSVITLLDQQRQQKIQKIFNYHIMKKRFTNTKWKQEGITVAGGNGMGSQLNQLFGPEGICIDDDQTIYIADCAMCRIVEWKCNATAGQIVAGGNGEGNQTNQLKEPRDVVIDPEKNSLIISDRGNRRVMRWSRQNNTNGEIIISDIDCSGLTMDKDGSLYVSNSRNNEVRRWKRGDQNGTIVAGGNGKGDHLNQFNCSSYIFVDEDYSLYVADYSNHRVMKWVKDAKEGVIVAGGNGSGNSLKQLYGPKGVIADQLGQIYVVDSNNHRVMHWCKGAKEGTIVVGGNRLGQESNQLNSPTHLSFDRQGNLYVNDWGNSRTQKFAIN